MLADSLENAEHCIQLAFRSTETKKQQKNTHDTPFSEDVQFNSFEFSRKKNISAIQWINDSERDVVAYEQSGDRDAELKCCVQRHIEFESRRTAKKMNNEHLALLWKSFIMW